MKTLCLFLISTSLFSAEAPPKELYYQANKSTSETISLKVLNNLRVNDVCFSKKTECLALIKKVAVKEKKSGSFKGNPASEYCLNIGGDSIILKDKKYNEYDYCRLGEHFLVDSWDLFKSVSK